LQDYTTSIPVLSERYNNSQDAYNRSTANLLMGQAYQKLDMPEEAISVSGFRVSIPKAYDSFTALSI
jgi:hypothetical protein